MKPSLPEEIQVMLPEDIIRVINSFVPHFSKKKTPTVSPSLQSQLIKLQRSPKRGKNEMYLKGFEEFILD